LDLRFKEIAGAVDISKGKFDICIRNSKIITAESSYTNDTTGCEGCYRLLMKNGCLDVAIESTGSYWYGLHDYLTSRGISVVVVNPSRAKTNLANKSDKIDCRALATLHLLNLLEPSYVPDPEIRKLRRLARLRMKIVDMKTMIKNMANASASAYSSSITKVFSDMFGVSGKKMLDMLGMNQDEIVNELEKMKIKDEKKEEITDSISKAYTPSLDSWMIQLASSMISQIEAWIKILDDAMASAVESIPRIKEYVNRLLTIPGMGLETAQAIAAEIADITRFKQARSLVRYSGINPTVEQSGSMKKYGRLEKRGPKMLRRALYQAAGTMAFRGPHNFRDHYNAVSSRYGSKGHRVGVVSTARKLLHLIHAMLTNGTEYIPSPVRLTESKRRKLRSRSMNHDRNEKPSLVKLLLNIDKLDDEVKEMLIKL
jgi:transposase